MSESTTDTGHDESAVGGRPQESDEIPGTTSGAGVGAGEPNTFEPEEGGTEGEAVEDSPASTEEELPAVEGSDRPTGEHMPSEGAAGDA